MMHEYSQKSMILFKVNLYQRYGKRNSRKKFEYIDLKRSFCQFVSEYLVVLSTTHSLRNCMQDNYLFDYLIIDEASQVDLVTGALVLSCAKKKTPN
jgi:superfamily I DNA and/or RNA helicase